MEKALLFAEKARIQLVFKCWRQNRNLNAVLPAQNLYNIDKTFVFKETLSISPRSIKFGFHPGNNCFSGRFI